MITWILGGILVFYCLFRRFLIKGGKIANNPLGMPRGTIRAFITILIVSFPFTYILNAKEVPGLVVSSIFFLVAFYFETRRSKHEELWEIIKKIKNQGAGLKEAHPLYLPKYSVRIILITLIILISIVNFLGPNIPFQSQSTMIDLIVLVFLFILGSFFRALSTIKNNKKIKERVLNTPNYQSLSEFELMGKTGEINLSHLKKKAKNRITLITLFATLIALFLYTIEWDLIFFSILSFQVSLRSTLFVLVDAYYGFRD